MGQTWVRCSSSTRRRNRKRSPIPVSAKIIDEEVHNSLNVFQLRVPDPDPGDEEENEESKEANK